ncbi:MAG TPA: glycosyltransferase family 4 protein [Bryobacteraceae bacterium]|nr:glycosyltransferase family 4 protein [Bryobacteraceae bacterium]HOL71491.1 glycosyltransferase family 4 protein [Bryobacteraceae bacterium]HOQ44530.1 glycosyltransferase family 4 protein [Bryobacteraceae bacterium]HPU70849.1 glycosyltransferase family 4 protein [Bryobacteraceae bacterium]
MSPAVLHLISSSGFYGAENMLLTLAKAQRCLGWRAVVGVFENSGRPGGEMAVHARRAGLEVESVPCNGRIDLSVVGRLRKLIHGLDISVLHTHGYKADLYGYAAARGFPVRLISTCHNWTNETRALRLYASLDRWILARFPLVAAVSPRVAGALRRAGVPANRLRLIANGIDVERFRLASGDLRGELARGGGPVIGMAGRLVPSKGFDDVIAVAPEVLSRAPGATFALLGDGPHRAALEMLASKTNVANTFVFLGRRDDSERFYASIDIFVLPSYNEGMPMTVLEAMAAGKPVIATRTGSIPNIVRHGETGLLYSPGDRKALAAALAELATDPGLARLMGTKGQEVAVREHSAEAMARQYLGAYEELQDATRG